MLAWVVTFRPALRRTHSSPRNLCVLSVSALDGSSFFVFFNLQHSKYGRPDLSCLECAVADKHRVLPVFSRNRPASSSLESTLMDLRASVANKRLMEWLNLLDATLTKNGGGPLTIPRVLPPPISKSTRFLSDRSLRTGRDVSLHSFLSTFNCQLPTSYAPPTHSPIRPIAARPPWCHNWHWHEQSLQSGETTPLAPVSKTRERTSGTVRRRSRSPRLGRGCKSCLGPAF